MVSLEAIRVLTFLIPGFISSTVYDVLVERSGQTESRRLVEALIFSMIAYSIYAPLLGVSPVKLDDTTSQELVYSSFGLAVLVGLAVILPCVIAAISVNGVHTWIARKLRITNRTGRHTVWLDVFETKDCFIEVNLRDGRILRGWPEFVGHRPDDQWIYLHNPECITEDGQWQSMETEGMLINRTCHEHETIDYINFLRSRKGQLEKENDHE